jgi:hypothetical protein
MIKGGKGGSHTNRTGLKFEKNTDLSEALMAAGFEVVEDSIFREGTEVGTLMEKNKLYAFLRANEVDWRNIISARLCPDEAVFAKRARTLTIIEKKWQEVSGSVDEKLQTSGFKLRQYRRLFEPLEIPVKFIYLLSDWFTQPRYADVLEYIKDSGADYHFETLPLELLDL